MGDYKDRLREELKELSERLEKLEAFLLTDTFDKLETLDADLLIVQLSIMREYESVLTKRVKRL